MNPILDDFVLDLARLKRIFTVSKQLVAFPSCVVRPEDIVEEVAKEPVVALYEATKDAHKDMPILHGVLLLYLAGRFENYVKEIFEDLCDALAAGCTEFAHLPKKMQENLSSFTGQVVANPRRYGHAENGVVLFVNTLSENLAGKIVAGVNSKCLSITEYNMWPDTLSEMFGRIGADKVWERIGQQATVQAFFQTGDPNRATAEAKAFLSAFMDTRNKLAHPSGALTWPSIEQAEQHVSYCEVIGKAIADLCAVWITSLPVKPI